MTPTPARPRVPLGLVGMLVLVVLGEAGVAAHALDLLAPWHWDWRLTGAAAGKEARGCDVLLMGDSLVKFGVVPRALEGKAGAKVYNLGLCMGQAPATYFLLRRALEAGARPKSVVVTFAPHLLLPGPRYNGRQWPEMLTPAEAIDLALASHDFDLLAGTLVGRLLPTARTRPEIRAAVALALAGQRATQRFSTPRFLRNWRVNRGAIVMPPIPLRDDPATWQARLAPFWAADPTNAAYIGRFLDLARRHEIAVTWLLAPPSVELQALCEASGFDAGQTAFVRSWQARYPDLSVLDARRSGYPQEVHTDDPVHLNRDGAAALSAAVADALAAARPGAWVELPAYRAADGPRPFEDVHASELALGREAKGRRR